MVQIFHPRFGLFVKLGLLGLTAIALLAWRGVSTLKQYWRRWKNPCFVVMVLANHDLNQVTWEQRALAGDPKFAPSL
jgi:pyruvate dehydrogenase (quinone)